MVVEVDRKINNCLFVASARLSDVEVDYGEWGDAEFAGFQMEWADVASRVNFLKQVYDQMTADQKAEFEALKQRFLAASGELTKLGLENPFMP